MKLSSLFAMVVIVSGLAFSSSAHATTFNVGTLGPNETGTLVSKSDSGFHAYNYIVSGALSAYTQVTITLKATNVYLGGLLTGSKISTSEPVSLLPPSVWPTLSGSSGVLTKSITLTNGTGSTEYFSSYFLALILAGCKGLITLSYATSAVPLPGALLLFGSGLTALAGVARKKRR